LARTPAALLIFLRFLDSFLRIYDFDRIMSFDKVVDSNMMIGEIEEIETNAQFLWLA
jgi:hypothetical protein